MRIAVIGRADPTGLGSLTVDFCRNIAVSKALIVDRSSRGETISGDVLADEVRAVPAVDAHLDWALEGVDVVVGFETFYSPAVIPIARHRSVKTAMLPMWECSPAEVGGADYVLSLTDKGMEAFPGSIRCSWPMEPLGPQMASQGLSFVCNGGSLGLNNRNNVDVVAAAVKAGCFDGTHAELLLRCHSWDYSTHLAELHPKIVCLPATKTRAELYNGASVHVHLQGLNGLSLPLLESAACGIPQVVMDLPCFDSPHRVPVGRVEVCRIGQRVVEYARPNVDDVAKVLRDLATGAVKPTAPPKPPTWAEFREFFRQTVGAA